MRVGTVLKDNRQHNKWEDIAFTGKGQGPLFLVTGLGPTSPKKNLPTLSQ